MDTHRFDHAIRSLHDGAPRRQVLGVLLGGALGIAGLAGNEVAAKKGKKVTLCLNGQTVSVKKSKKAQFLSQGATVGACPKSPPSPQSPPPPSCPTTQKLCDGKCIDKTSCCTDADCDKCRQQTCQNGSCSCKPGTAPDANGFCGMPQRPGGANCAATGSTVSSPAFCCSEVTVKPNLLVDQWLCLPGSTFCQTSADCGGVACKGFMCPAFYAAIVGEGCS